MKSPIGPGNAVAFALGALCAALALGAFEDGDPGPASAAAPPRPTASATAQRGAAPAPAVSVRARATAAAPGPERPTSRLLLSTGTVIQRDGFEATATGFAPDERIRLTWSGESTGTFSTATAGPAGSVSLALRADMDPGSYTLRAIGLVSGRITEARLTVRPGPVETAPAPEPGRSAGAEWPELALSDASVPRDREYRALATGFEAGEAVRFTWSGAGTGTFGEVRADSAGRAALTLRLADAGAYLIEATGADSGRSARSPVLITD
ncbi:hypothetical protein [Streptomyces sp. NPDC097619]|uniref:hypothetical protein n=1 Tax=Streptomyces sp. NPDC097619 TaxID=3157228 RepID=UPI00333416AB